MAHLQDNVGVVKDSRGRQLSVNAMDPADQLDFFKACDKQGMKPAWVTMAMWACSVVSIDGEPISMPTSPSEVKALARRLGHDGLAAVRRHLNGEDSVPGGVDMDLAKN